MKQRLISLALPLCLCLVMPLATCAEPPRQAVVPFDSPDPTALMAPDGKGLYVFTTGRGIQILYSTNFLDWERIDRVFTGDRFPAALPDWARQAIPRARGLWAPDVVFHNDQYYVYYAISTVGSQRSAIGLATNKTLDKTSPDYQWKDEGMVLESHPDHTDYNAIDSALFVDNDGKAYLFWGSYWTGLKAVEIDAKTGKPSRYVPGDLKIPADYVAVASRPDTSIEAPYVIRRGKYYYLFVSWGTTLDDVNSTYRIAVGRSEKPLGPYIDKEGKRMDQGGGTVIFTGTDAWKGTGHNGFFRTTQEGKNKGDWLIFHAYDAKDGRRGRLTQIRPLYWDESDWCSPGEILAVPFGEFDFSTKK
jgi:arabinan endo-1,5-alpha-L-arabinosidase